MKHQLFPGNTDCYRRGKHQLLSENTNCHRGTTDSYRTTPTATGKHKVSLGKQQPKCYRDINGYREIPMGEHKLLPEKHKLLLGNVNCYWLNLSFFLPYFVLLHPYFHLLYRHLSTSAAGVIDLTTQFHRLYAFPSIFQSYKWSFLYFSSRCYPYTHPFLSSLLF